MIMMMILQTNLQILFPRKLPSQYSNQHRSRVQKIYNSNQQIQQTNKQIIQKMFITLLVFFFVQDYCTCNLIRKGDFEQYSTIYFNHNGLNMKWGNFNLNLSNWYVQGYSYGEIFAYMNLSQYTTLSTDMSLDKPVNICQNANLSIGSKYVLSYSMFSTIYYKNMVARAHINDVLATKFLIANPSSFGAKSYQFFSDRVANKFCFNQSHQASPPHNLITNTGGLLDNVSLLLIQKEYIRFNYTLKQVDNLIILSGNTTYNEYFAVHVQNRYDVSINGKFVNYIIYSSDVGNITVQISVNFSCFLKDIQFVLKNQLINETQMVAIFNPTDKYYHYLNQKQSVLLTSSKGTMLFANQQLEKISSYSRVFFCSYFLNIIIDLQFVSFFYIFMQISVVPTFTKQFYYTMLNVAFSPGLIQSLQNIFKISSKNLQPNAEDEIPEKVETQKNNEPWFGSYDLSSKIIKNNFSNIISIVWLALKFGLLKLSIKLLFKFFPYFRGKVELKTTIWTLLLTQYCFMMPSFLISIIANIVNPVSNFLQKLYKIGSLILLFFNFVCCFLYIFQPSFNRQKQIELKPTEKNKMQISANSLKNEDEKTLSTQIMKKQNLTQKTRRKRKRSQKKKTKRKTKTKLQIRFSQQAFTIPLLFFIPIMAFIGDPIMFLIINTFTVLFRFFAFLRPNHQNDSKAERVLDFIIGFVWLIHHTIFFILFFYQDSKLTENQMNIIFFLGFSSILTVISIAILQSIKLIIATVLWIIQTVKFVRKCCQEKQNKKMEEQNVDKDNMNDMRQVIFIQVIKNQSSIKQPEQKKNIQCPQEIQNINSVTKNTFQKRNAPSKKNKARIKKPWK